MKMAALPSLNALRSFAAAGTHLSFTAAALELHVTQGAVSRLVRSLEESLGVTLLRAEGKRLVLTEAGATYHREVAASLARIAAATAALSPASQDTGLVLDVLPTLGMRWLVPRLADFRRREPPLRVEVVAGDGPPDLAGPWDLAIRFGQAPWAGLVATRFMEEEIGVVCAPSLLARLRPGEGVARLPPALLMQHTTRAWAWRDFFAAAGLAPPDLSRSQGFEHLFMLAEAAMRGQGFALVPMFLIADDLASGKLVAPIAERLKPAGGYYLLARPGRLSPPLRRFRQWLQAAAQAGSVI
jgi:LysR family transcriptional regulator, glycine cleavage system transcriptional activator